MVIGHFFTTLETDAHSFGLRSPSKVEKKLTRNPVEQKDKSIFLSHGFYPYLWII
jgi:hypothetical protein